MEYLHNVTALLQAVAFLVVAISGALKAAAYLLKAWQGWQAARGRDGVSRN